MLLLVDLLAEKYSVGYEWLRFNIHESVVLSGCAIAMGQLTRLREAGVLLQLDKYGQGYMPINSIKSFPFSAIRFNAQLLEQDNDALMRVAMLNIIKGVTEALRVKLVAINVESQEMFDWLKAEDVHLVQGEAISSPVTQENMEESFMSLN